MILPYNTFWLHYLKDIDIKSYYHAWLDEDWTEIEKWIVKVWCVTSDKPEGFTAFRFKDGIIIEKLAVHPRRRGKGGGSELLETIERIAKNNNVNKLTITLHEDNEYKEWATKRGFKATGIVKGLGPGDRFRFCKVVG